MKKPVHRRKARFSFLDVLNILVMVYLLLPIAIIFLFSFNPNSAGVFPMQGFSGKWYVNLVQNRNFLVAAKNSVYVALAVAALSTVIGTLASFALTRYSFPLKSGDLRRRAHSHRPARDHPGHRAPVLLLLPGTHAVAVHGDRRTRDLLHTLRHHHHELPPRGLRHLASRKRRGTWGRTVFRPSAWSPSRSSRPSIIGILMLTFALVLRRVPRHLFRHRQGQHPAGRDMVHASPGGVPYDQRDRDDDSRLVDHPDRHREPAGQDPKPPLTAKGGERSTEEEQTYSKGGSVLSPDHVNVNRRRKSMSKKEIHSCFPAGLPGPRRCLAPWGGRRARRDPREARSQAGKLHSAAVLGGYEFPDQFKAFEKKYKVTINPTFISQQRRDLRQAEGWRRVRHRHSDPGAHQPARREQAPPAHRRHARSRTTRTSTRRSSRR